MARVPYVTPQDLPEEYNDKLASLASREDLPGEYRHLHADELNIYRIFGHQPEILVAFRQFGGAIWEELDVSSRQREIVTLTVIGAMGARYEWHQHVRVALQTGLDPDEIRALGKGNAEAFDGVEATLVRYALRFAEGTVDDQLHEELSEYFDDSTIVGIAITASMYMLTTQLMDALAVEPETTFVDWDLENL